MQYQFNNFVIDPDNFELRKNDQPVELRAKAFHVLSFLLKNRHRMVHKDELLDEVWHKQFIAESTLNSCIKTVRQTLGDDGKNQHIVQTVRGLGYRFVAPVEMIKTDARQSDTISSRLGERFDKTFVGRQQELKTVLDAFSEPAMPYWVCYIYGSGGIGKTSLLKNLCRKTTDKDMAIYVDCRDHEPTEKGFLQGLAKQIQQSMGVHSDADIVFTLEGVSRLLADFGGRVLLCIDQFESFNIMETWMRQTFFPSLPDTVLTVIASRQAPKTAWYLGSEWANAFHMLELGELPEQEVSAMLESRKLNKQQISQIKKFAHGYPLALELAAMLCRTQPDYDLPAYMAPIEVVTKLTTSVLSGLSDVEKEAIEALSTVHRANEPVLCALLGLRDAQKLFVKLRELPIVNYSSQGIALHDVVRDAVSQDLGYRDPARGRQYRKNAWAYFKDEVDKISGVRLWQHTANMLFLLDNPIVRGAYFPAGSHEFTIEQATDKDVEQILQISRGNETAQASAINERWLQKYRQHFYVAKAADNNVKAFEYYFVTDNVDREDLLSDPVSAAWLAHLEANPVKENEKCLFLRRWVTQGKGDALSPAQAAFWVDIKRVYMSMRSNLRRLYTTFTHHEEYAPVVGSVNFQFLDDCHVTIDDQQFTTVMVDFGENSIDGWLTHLVKNQLDDS